MIKMKKILSILTVISLGAVLAACAQGPKLEPAMNGYHKQKVAYHINNMNSAFGALRNVKNHLNAVGDKNVDLIVVTHSSGAFSLVEGSKDAKGRSMKDAVNSLANRGVKFQICANTIRGKKINKGKISLHAEIVPSGVAQVSHLQQMGYTYVKP